MALKLGNTYGDNINKPYEVFGVTQILIANIVLHFMPNVQLNVIA